MLSISDSEVDLLNSLNIVAKLFLGNGVFGPKISRNAIDMEIKNPIKIKDSATTGLKLITLKFKNTINIFSNDLLTIFKNTYNGT